MDRNKSLSGIDRDRVARHRNQMHDIALQKQISVIQREGKLIERELREITKVKNTLMQIRSPFKKRVLRNEAPCRETKQPTRKCATSNKRISSKTGKKEQRSNKVESSIPVDGCEFERPKLKPIAEHDGSPACRKQLIPAANLHSSHEQNVGATGFCSLQPTDEGKNIRSRKISFGENKEQSERGLENVEKRLSAGENPSLPPVDVFTNSSSCSNRRLSKREANTDMLTTRSATPLSKPVRSVSVQDRPETSMTVGRKSKLSEQPLTELSLPAATRSRQDQEQEQLTLTMEETLRIKGKFRQIGHSIIATALLKGIKQRGNLSSEAIHNMHKPVMVSDKSTTEDHKHEDNESNDVEPVKTGLEKFRKVTRKALNVNGFINNSRQKSAKELQQRIGKTEDEENSNEGIQDSPLEHGKMLIPRKRFAGVGHAVLFTRAVQNKNKTNCTDTNNENMSIMKKPLMNSSTLERRKNLNGIASMATSPSPNTAHASELPKNKVVTFRLNAWE